MHREPQFAGLIEAHRSRALALLVEGAKLRDVLLQILEDLEMDLPGARCSLLQVCDGQLANGLSPSLPASYMAAVDGTPIAEGVGSCGTAAFRNARVVVANIPEDPLWAPYLELAESAGVKACWSEPVRSAKNEVIGTFAVYYPEPRMPSETELRCIESATTLVALAIAQHQGMARLKKLSQAVRYSPTGVAITSDRGVIEYCNARFREITGYSREELYGQSLALLRSNETPMHIYKDLWQTIQSGRNWRGEILNRRKNGESYLALDHIAPIVDDEGAVVNYVLSQEDVTHIRKMETDMSFVAQNDQLTGLPNRESFKVRLIAAINDLQREGQFSQGHYLVMLDLDNFKLVNEAAGRVAGDQVLRQAVNRIQAAFPENCGLARLGGDQFALLLSSVAAQQVTDLLDALFTRMAGDRFRWNAHEFVLSLSAGVVELCAETDLREALLQVESACFAAKQAGRRGYHIYRPGDDQVLQERQGYVQWAQEVRRALDESRFELYGQRIQPLQADNLPGYEVLLRLRMADGRLVAPGAFMPAAERYNLMQELDRWVLQHALAWCIEHPDVMKGIDRLAINLSGFSLSDAAMLSWVEQQVQATPTLARKLKFEITETVCIENIALAEQFIRTLQALGCQFALDDFGSGLSSFGYLKNLPVDTLKIDWRIWLPDQ